MEFVRSAVDEFFAEAELTPTVSEVDGFAVLSGNGVSVWVGDLFALTPAHVGRFDAVWDRAALVAVGPERFLRYVEVERHLLADDGVLLLTALVRGDELGPPWSVPENSVRHWYAGAGITLLDVTPNADGPGWQELVFQIEGAAR